MYLQAWDLGGHEAVRYLWFDFLGDSHAIVFMIDRADGERLEEAHWELSELLSDVSPLRPAVLFTFRMSRASASTYDCVGGLVLDKSKRTLRQGALKETLFTLLGRMLNTAATTPVVPSPTPGPI